MTQNKSVQVSKSTIDEGVIQPSLEIPEKSAAAVEDNPAPDSTGAVPEVKLSPVDDDAISTLSSKETKVNFGFLPIPRRCRITPTKPFKFNLAINILFGFASTFTVQPHTLRDPNILNIGGQFVL
jgi:hypothetical protein